MPPKYIEGQKVKIVEVKNEHGHPKYPEIQEHINKTGIVLESLFIPTRGLEGTSLEGEILDQYMDKIQLDKDDAILDAIMEDALAPLNQPAI